MATFKVLYPNGSIAKYTKVTISFYRGGTKNGFTDGRGYVTISGSNTYGKIYVAQNMVYTGKLNIGEVRIKKERN